MANAKWSSDWSVTTSSFCPPPQSLPKSPLYFPLLPHRPAATASTFSSRKQQRVLLVTSSTKSTSPLLEDASNALQTFGQPARVPDRDITNELIHAVCRNPQTEALAFGYYQSAKEQPSFRPDHTTLKLLLRCLLRLHQWSSISSMIEDLQELSLIPDAHTCSRLVGSCIRARKFKLAESVLGVVEAEKGDTAISCFSSAMRAYNQLHMYNCTISVYECILRAGVPLNSSCYRWIIEAYGELGDAEKVLTLFTEFESKCSEPSADAIEIVSVLCHSLGRLGRAFQALRYFREMEAKGIAANSSIYASLMSAFADIREAEIVDDLFQEALAKGLIKDQAVFMKLVMMYVDVDLVEKTLDVVEIMRSSRIRATDCVVCTVINGFVRKRGLRAAVAAYDKMISLGCEPGQVTYASVINVYCRIGLSKKAEDVFSEMIDKGFDKCVVAYSNMISMYGRIGKVKEAMQLLGKMKEKGCKPNVWVYNSLLDIHGRLMNLSQVEKLLREMNRRKIKRDIVSYTSIISAYSKSRKLNECIEFYEEFKRNGGDADRALAGIMVGVFSKTSRTEELIKLLQDMKANGRDLDERLHESALNALRDAGLQVHVKWFRKSFAFERDNLARKVFSKD